MRHAQQTKNTVRQLRRSGKSLNEIQEKTKIPKTTIRDWTSDISLSTEQLSILRKRALLALQKGRVHAQLTLKKMSIQAEKNLIEKGITEIGKLTPRELFIAGVALYWAEGFKNKHEHRLGFCNSDPDMICFYLIWLSSVLNIGKSYITARISLNESYTDKEQGIKEYWSKITEIPLSQFTKTFYQKTSWKKTYDNDNYRGVLRIHVKESVNHLRLMKGWIQGLKTGT